MLAVGHDELIVGDDEDAHRRLPRDGARVEAVRDHVVGPGLVMWQVNCPG